MNAIIIIDRREYFNITFYCVAFIIINILATFPLN